MNKIKTLVVDDSVVYRSQIRTALEEISQIELVRTASNGRLALERLKQESVDLLILDLEMPEMDGLQTLKEIKEHGYQQTKVLVFSSASKRGADITMEALSLGASDFIPKPGPTIAEETTHEIVNPSEKIKLALEPRIKALFPKEFMETVVPPRVHHGIKAEPLSVNWKNFVPQILVIGSSTGGPTVLEKIFSEVKSALHCPVVIVQHMPPVFTTQLAERLQRFSGIIAHEVKHEMLLENNNIYVAPGNYHTRIVTDGDKVKFHLDQGPLINSVRPAVDPLFESAAAIYQNACMGFVLTGMGMDGKVGAEKIKALGGAIVIQSEETCVVFGMPGAVHAIGAYDRIATPSEFIGIMREKVCSQIGIKVS